MHPQGAHRSRDLSPIPMGPFLSMPQRPLRRCLGLSHVLHSPLHGLPEPVPSLPSTDPCSPFASPPLFPLNSVFKALHEVTHLKRALNTAIGMLTAMKLSS